MSDSTVTVVGNIAKPPEARVTPQGSKVATITVASHRGLRTEGGWSQTETSYFDVEMWDALADNAVVSLRKGMSVLVHGHIRTSSWTDSEGHKRFKQKLIAKAIGPNLRWQQATVTRVTANQEFEDAQSEWQNVKSTSEVGANDGGQHDGLSSDLPTGTFDTSMEEAAVPA